MENYLFEKKKLTKYLGETLYDTFKSYNVIIAGGTITSLFTRTEINDIDVYFRSKEDLKNFLTKDMRDLWVVAHTDKALLFTHDNVKVQLIYFKFFDDTQEIFNTFDFTVCMGAYDFKTEEFILHSDFMQHNSQRILKFNPNTSYPIVSALRVDKYKKKGYSISKPEFIRIMLTILKSNINDYQTLKEQMGGMYGENYDNLLKPLEGEEFDLESIIDKMVDMCVDDSYFKTSESTIEIDDWDEFVHKILGYKVKCFKYNDEVYKLFDDKLRVCTDYDDNEFNYELVDISNIITFPIIRYKYVNNKHGDYRSYYRSSYKYNIGEHCTNESNLSGLHAAKRSNINYCTYCDEKDNVLLELRIDSIDDVFSIEKLLNENCDFKRVFVTRVIPKEEEKDMRKDIKNSEVDGDVWDCI